MEETSNSQFLVTAASIIFDPKERKILVARKNGDPELPNLTWCFPGTELPHGVDMQKHLFEKIKEKTGYEIKNLGTIFAKVYPENPSLAGIYFLCEITAGELNKGPFYEELRWVAPEDLEKLFTTSFHSRLKEYIMNLK